MQGKVNVNLLYFILFLNIKAQTRIGGRIGWQIDHGSPKACPMVPSIPKIAKHNYCSNTDAFLSSRPQEYRILEAQGMVARRERRHCAGCYGDFAADMERSSSCILQVIGDREQIVFNFIFCL